MNESIQILNSFYTRLLKLSGQMHAVSAGFAVVLDCCARLEVELELFVVLDLR